MPDNGAPGGGDSGSGTLKQQVNADLFGDDGTDGDPPAAADGGRDDLGRSEQPASDDRTRDRTATSVFGDLKDEEEDDVDAVFDHYGVDSTEEVLSAEGSSADPGWSTDPVVIGEDDGGFGDLLLDDRDEGEEFNWVAAEEAAATPAADGETRPDAVDDPLDDGSGPESGPDDRDGDATESSPGPLDAALGTGGETARDDGTAAAPAEEPETAEEPESVADGEESVADAEESTPDAADAADATDDERPGLLRRIVRRITALF